MVLTTKYFLVSVILISYLFVDAQFNNNSIINISLADYNASVGTTQVFKTNTTIPPETNIEILVTDVHRLIRYFIIQVHSFQLNIALSNTTNFSKNTTVNGTNIGLVQLTDQFVGYKFYVSNKNAENVSVLALVAAYQDNVPIPGGCNMEYMVEIAPYQRLNYTNDLVTVDAQSTSVEGYVCENFLVNYTMYHMYLPVKDFSMETYFTALQKMITPEDIIKHGRQVYKHIPNQQLRRLYSAYHGTGTIYALIATFNDNSAAYIPITTYACDALNSDSSCNVPATNLVLWICGILLFIGFLICFSGHRYFKTEMFVTGALVGSIFSYMGLLSVKFFNDTDLLITSAAIGIIVGIVWLVVWIFFGIPVLSIILPIFLLGFTFACILFQAALGDIIIFESDLNYWGVLTCITLLTITVVIVFTHKANIIACSILGPSIIIITLENYDGGNLKYVLTNVFRRATVENFEYAVLSPPYQQRDIIMTGVWLTLAIMGSAWQFIRQKGRSPFPPPPLQTERIQQLNENTPLLAPIQANNSDPSAPNDIS